MNYDAVEEVSGSLIDLERLDLKYDLNEAVEDREDKIENGELGQGDSVRL